MDKIRMRPMQPEDWPAVSDIYRLGIETGIATFERSCPSYEVWDQNHLQSCRPVAVDGNRIAGWAALNPVSKRQVYDGVAEISIYIHPDYRGKGIGRLLLWQLIVESEAAGFWTLQASILDANEASIAIHEHCGFRTVGYRERIARDHNGQWRNTVLMERRSDKF